jgi:tetratricopeptide (TPR) repeat protein
MLGRRRLQRAVAFVLWLSSAHAILAQFNQAVKLDEVGSQRYQAGDLDGAIAAFRQAVSLNPNDSLAYSNLGLALMDKGNLPEAAMALERSIGIIDARAAMAPAPHPSSSRAYSVLGIALNNLAIVRYQQGQLDVALAAVTRALQAATTYPDAWVTRGVILEAQGKLDLAIAAFRQAEALNPMLASASQNLGQALQKNGQVDAGPGSGESRGGFRTTGRIRECAVAEGAPGGRRRSLPSEFALSPGFG